ncbi:HesB/IscA family protein [Methylocella sp.]|uniref:HesB/IscA family protein n=1 Tax=Methylocella sp. TaxID=1978226 RepID=UPI003784C491
MAQPKFAVLSLTERAAEHARALLAGLGKPGAGIRVGIRNGGCAGMSYTLDLAEAALPGDEVVEDQGVRLIVAAKDLLFLLGTKLDFEADKLSSSFTFINPNQTSACGCGESVAITPANA